MLADIGDTEQGAPLQPHKLHVPTILQAGIELSIYTGLKGLPHIARKWLKHE